MSKREIVHIEIPVSDRDGAPKFYTDLFGWDHEDIREMNYGMWKAGNISGGYVDVGDDFKPGDTVFYIASDDIDADLKQIEGMGGKTLLPKTEIPDMGWFAFFADPTGNRVGLFEDGSQ